ncbi:MAG: hypothetical protein ACKVKM_03420 [Verrucomicrobiia bacterium]|jgi:hypothetical protein|tara:strand:+ start:215 stop:391 length:177 start_codon:yes stop_codon:yes gene_type:complete
MKMEKLFGMGLMVAALMASPARAQDGAPDAKPEARAVAAVKTLNTEKQVTLLYVKGMT